MHEMEFKWLFSPHPGVQNESCVGWEIHTSVCYFLFFVARHQTYDKAWNGNKEPGTKEP